MRLKEVLFFSVCHYWYSKGNHDGTQNDYWAVGTVMMAAVVIQANLKLTIDMSYYDYFSIIFIALSALLYIFTIAIADSDWLLPQSIVKEFYILDNFREVIIDLKFLFSMILVCTFCCFLEIFANKMPILFGLIIEGKFLPPYKRNKNNKKKVNLINNDEDKIEDEDKNDKIEIKEK